MNDIDNLIIKLLETLNDSLKVRSFSSNKPFVNSGRDSTIDGLAQFLNSFDFLNNNKKNENDVCIAVYCHNNKLLIAGNRNKVSEFPKELCKAIEDFISNKDSKFIKAIIYADIVDRLTRCVKDLENEELIGEFESFNELDADEKSGIDKLAKVRVKMKKVKSLSSLLLLNPSSNLLKKWKKENSSELEFPDLKSLAEKLGREGVFEVVKEIVEGNTDIDSLHEKFEEFLGRFSEKYSVKNSSNESVINILKSYNFLTNLTTESLISLGIQNREFVIPNDSNSAEIHAEQRIVEKIYAEKGEIIDHIGIDKDCCVLCYSVMKSIEIENFVRGTHARSLDPRWKLPNIVKDNFKENFFIGLLYLLKDDDLEVLLRDLDLGLHFSEELIDLLKSEEGKSKLNEKFKQWYWKSKIKNKKYNRHVIIQVGRDDEPTGIAALYIKNKEFVNRKNKENEVSIFKIDSLIGELEESTFKKLESPEDILLSIVIDGEDLKQENIEKLSLHIEKVIKDKLVVNLGVSNWKNKISLSIFACGEGKEEIIKSLFNELNKDSNKGLIDSIVFRKTLIRVGKNGVTQYLRKEDDRWLWEYRSEEDQKAIIFYDENDEIKTISLPASIRSGEKIDFVGSKKLGLSQDEKVNQLIEKIKNASDLRSSEWNAVAVRTIDKRGEILFKFVKEDFESQGPSQDERWIEINNQEEFTILEEVFRSKSLKLALYQNEAFSLTEEFHKVIKEIVGRNSEISSSEWVPIIRETKTELGGSPELLFVNLSDKTKKQVEINSEEFREITWYRDYLDWHLNSLRFSSFTKESFNFEHIQHVEGVDGLNAYFIIQTIFDLVNSKKEETNDSTLDKVIKAHTYLNYAQIGVTTLSDASNLYKLTQIIKNPNFVLGGKGIFGKGLGVIGKGLGPLINSGLVINDIIELSSPGITEEQKAIFGTNLFFDSAGLASAGVGLFAGGTVAASAGILAVPLAGIGIGVTALVESYLKANQESLYYARYFWQYRNDYRDYQDKLKILELNDQSILPLSYKNAIIVNNQIITEDADSLELNPVVIKKIDLTNSDKVKLELGTNYLFKTNRAEENASSFPFGNYLFGNFGASVGSIKTDNKENAINLTRSLFAEEHKIVDILNNRDNLEIILPVTLESFIDYSYNAVSLGFRYRGDSELQVTDIIQVKEAFSFRYYQWPQDYAIRSLSLKSIDTEIEIKLGSRNFTFVTPIISDNNADKLNYIFSEGSGTFTLITNNQKRVKYEIKTSSSKLSSWTIILQGKEIVVQNKQRQKQQIKDLLKEFKIDTDFNNFNFIMLNIKTKNSLYQINNWELRLTSVSGSGFNSSLEERKYIKNVIDDSHYTGFIPITDHHLDDETIIPKAWYDPIHKEYIYPNY